MRLIDKLKDRYNILFILLSIIFLIIIFRLAKLTVVEGEKYREISENKRMKNIPITAPRGEIRDRYGRLLAGNKPSFTVQVMKDELTDGNLNNTALELMTLLDEQGENYVDNFPIVFNCIEYKNIESYYDNDPLDEIADLIIKYDLTTNVLDTIFYNKSQDRQFLFMTGQKAIQILENEGISIPIEAYYDGNNVIYTFNEDKDVNEWKSKNALSESLSAKNALIKLLTRDSKNIKKLLNYPIIRHEVFNILEKVNLSNKFIMKEYAYTYDQQYQNIKRSLIGEFNDITMNTSAKQDFAKIVINKSIDDLLTNVYSTGNSEENTNEEIIPVKILLDELRQKGISHNVEIQIDSQSKKVRLNYNGISEETEILEYIKDLAIENNLLKEVITSDKVKIFAQRSMLNTGINPKISISKWQYTPIISKYSWLQKHGIDNNMNAKQAFEYLINRYEIKDDLSNYEARLIMIIIEQLNKQGYRAYQPVNIAYSVKDSTVAKIMENNLNLPGVNISIDPIRYYPMDNTAAHIVGYLGKISQHYEIQKYINELKYSPNAIIGKTGIEKKFEQYLKGKNGYKKVEVDVFGNTINTLEEKKAIPGDTLYLTIDAKLQKVAEDALKHALEEIQKAGEFKSKWGNYNYSKEDGRLLKNATSGSTVAIDVKTGEVLALVNYPAYDPNLFATGISSEDWEDLKPKNEKNPLAPRPLYNIALRTAVQPGSIFKMITSLAALEKGINPYKKIDCYGYVELGNRTYADWIWTAYRSRQGLTDMFKAIKDSVNYYFYTLVLGENNQTGKDIGLKLNFNDIINMAKKFGLDEKTGIEIPGELAGRVPSKKNKTRYANIILKRFLNDNKDKLVDNKELDDDEIDKIIKTISSWIKKENLSRSEVRNKITNIGLNADKLLTDKVNVVTPRLLSLTDYIKYTYFNQAKFKTGDLLNLSIGQGENSYTPIQMANYIATLSNGGYKYKASVVDSVEDYGGKETLYEAEHEVERVNFTDKNYDYLQVVKKGMNLAAEKGTGKKIFREFPVKVGIKTGTAEKDGVNPYTGQEYDNYAWFVAFAPYDDPQIAVSTLIFQGGHGGYAGPVAREIIAQYLGLNTDNNEFNYKNELVK